MRNELNDMDILDFARKISMLPEDTLLASAYDKEYGQKGENWWSCQREHLTVWCLHYPIGGVKPFTHQPSNSARTMYKNFARPETLLWLAEALGEEQKTLQDTIEEIKHIKNCRTASSMLRKRISFDRILELLDKNST